MSEYKKGSKNSWVDAYEPQRIQAKQLLQEVKELGRSVARPAWIFDLDSTLINVENRTKRIFSSFLRSHPTPKSWWHQLIHHLDPQSQSYSIRETFENVLQKLHPCSEAKMKSYELWHEFEDFWMLHFFDSRYMYEDEPYPGAVEFVREVSQLGHSVIYLTGREHSKAFSGTRQNLKRLGFVMDPKQTQLLMKPERMKGQGDENFKRGYIETLRQNFDILCGIDNEPENVVLIRQLLAPSSHSVLFHTVMSRRIPEQAIKEPGKAASIRVMDSWKL